MGKDSFYDLETGKRPYDPEKSSQHRTENCCPLAENWSGVNREIRGNKELTILTIRINNTTILFTIYTLFYIAIPPNKSIIEKISFGNSQHFLFVLIVFTMTPVYFLELLKFPLITISR